MRRAHSFGALALAAAAASLHAADIGVVGLFPNKAVLVLGNAAPKTYAVGSVVADGVRLIAVDSAAATFDIQGRREAIALGEHVNRAAQMLLDTGATLVALPAADAIRLGIDYRKGRISQINTANGTTQAYLVRLDRVRVGDIELNQVDAVVQEQGLPLILLGMSFLNRTAMKRDGDQMTLTKRF